MIQNYLEGSNPNLSLVSIESKVLTGSILGVKEDINDEGKLADKGPLELIMSIREETASLQGVISGHYAESVGNDCAVQ